MPVHVISFSYRYGLPDTADQIFDMRFAKTRIGMMLRAQTGLDSDVATYIAADPVAREVLTYIKHILLKHWCVCGMRGGRISPLGLAVPAGGIGQFGARHIAD